MIDLSKTQLVCLAYPDGMIPMKTIVYFVIRGMPISNIVAVQLKVPITVARNQVIKNLILPEVGKYEWIIFMDKDNIPVEKLTDPFLDDVPYDVVGCQYDIGENKRAWLEPTVFHMGMCRIRAGLFPKLPPPWFKFEYNEDGTAVTLCECGYLSKKLAEIGASVTRRGYISHEESNRTWHTGA